MGADAIDLQRPPQITAETLLRAYQWGLFPMGESRDDPTIYWVDPDKRGVLPLDQFHVPRSLRRLMRRAPFRVTFDAAFAETIAACAAPGSGRRTTWINDTIEHLYNDLFDLGYAHSVECWSDDGLEPFPLEGAHAAGAGGAASRKQKGESASNRVGSALVGGLYGVAIGGAFFGESMFSFRRDASKVALVHLVERLRVGGYVLLDTQFITEHLRRFGAREVPRPKYLRQLAAALKVDADFHAINRAPQGG